MTGIVQTIDFGYCLLIGIARTIDVEGGLLEFGTLIRRRSINWNCPDNSFRRLSINWGPLTTETSPTFELSEQVALSTLNQQNLSGQQRQVGVY